MLKRYILRLAMLGSGTLWAIDMSPCGPSGEILELLLPMVILGLVT